MHANAAADSYAAVRRGPDHDFHHELQGAGAPGQPGQ